MERNKISIRNWILIWGLGLIGQLCWNLENQWFNTFVYANVGPYAWVISWMTAVSATATTFSTFFFGTLSDRKGKRRPFIFFGYLLWGIFTIAFGLVECMPKNQLMAAAVMVVLFDALMSFFGSMGNDAAYNSWTTDISNEHNRGQLSAALAVLPVLATILGTVVSGIAIDAMGYFSYFILAGTVVSVIGVFGVLLMKEGEGLVPNRDEKGFWNQFFSVFRFRKVLENKQLFWVFVIMTCYFTCFNFYFTHVGNYFIYTLGFDAGFTGIVEGAGLGLAMFATIPAAHLINKGKHVQTLTGSVAFTAAGLLLLSVCGSKVGWIVFSILLAGIGYVLVLQTTTAWAKNLYPEEARGQYEGVRIIFYVLLPMILGPSFAGIIIENFGTAVEIEGKAGMAPAANLFVVAAVLSLLSLVPTYFALKEKRKHEVQGQH